MLSDRYNLCRHSHLLETKAQQKLAQEKYGCSAVEHLKQIGYLSPRTSLAHCVWLSDADITILAETRSTVIHRSRRGSPRTERRGRISNARRQ